MIIQLQPEQLVDVWPAIRVGVENVGRIITNDPKFIPNILASLLAGKHQLWLVMDAEREVYGFVITCLISDNLTGELFLEMEMAYGFRQSTEELVVETYENLKQYARENACSYIKATTNIERAAQLMKLGGMKLSSQNYILRISP